jgi:hypothetical protein
MAATARALITNRRRVNLPSLTARIVLPGNRPYIGAAGDASLRLSTEIAAVIGAVAA